MLINIPRILFEHMQCLGSNFGSEAMYIGYIFPLDPDLADALKESSYF